MTILTTPRLVLRRFRLADLDALHALLSDPVVMRFSSSGVMDRRRAAEWLDWNIRMYAPGGPGIWAAVLRDSGQVIGQVGVIPQQIDGRAEIELAYRFLPACWGQGLGTEAAAAVRDYGFKVLETRRLVCLIEPENHPSRRVAEKIGMKLEREVIRVDKPTCVYAVTSSAPEVIESSLLCCHDD